MKAPKYDPVQLLPFLGLVAGLLYVSFQYSLDLTGFLLLSVVFFALAGLLQDEDVFWMAWGIVAALVVFLVCPTIFGHGALIAVTTTVTTLFGLELVQRRLRIHPLFIADRPSQGTAVTRAHEIRYYRNILLATTATLVATLGAFSLFPVLLFSVPTVGIIAFAIAAMVILYAVTAGSFEADST
jgi:hypothetical protein